MSFNQNKSFDVGNDGLSLGEAILLVGGASDPYGNDAPLGSRYFKTDGTEFIKIGLSVNDWHIVGETALNFTNEMRYLDMGTSLGGVNRGIKIDDTFTDLFNLNDAGLFFGFNVTLEKAEHEQWDIRLIIDGADIFGANGISTKDLEASNKYFIADDKDKGDHLFNGLGLKKDTIRFNSPLDRPIIYSSNVTIKVRKIGPEKKFRAGLIHISGVTL